MPNEIPLQKFTPPFKQDKYSKEDTYRLKPFFTNLTKSVYAPIISSPEVIGALCSRTSRAAGDLRKIFLEEYLKPFLDSDHSDLSAEALLSRPKLHAKALAKADGNSRHSHRHKQDPSAKYGKHLAEYIKFLHEHPTQEIFSNPRARSFYSKWLAQYGDDSIAQMAGMHLVFAGLSQLAIKHFEDQRIGLAPLEKSTRYVDYSTKIKGGYMYYTDPNLQTWGLEEEYRAAMDNLFQTYVSLRPKLQDWIQQKFPEESPGVIEKKAFDTLRGLLPVSTLSQVAFFGNGQAFEYLVARSLKHPLGEVRWAADSAYTELYKIGPSFLRRIKSDDSRATAEQYQEYMAGRGSRVMKFIKKALGTSTLKGGHTGGPAVELVEYDKQGENKVIAGMLYNADNNHASWDETIAAVQSMDKQTKRDILTAYLKGRTQRWQKVGRALENAYVRFDITMNIGAWRDLHRHRMLTQQRQLFTCAHGYDTPGELIDSGLDTAYHAAMKKTEAIYKKIARRDPFIAQYAVPMAYRMRFQQYKNLRACFWEMELRTIPEGHPDYRKIEQEKFKLLAKAYPLIAEHMHVNMQDYDFARRGQEEKIQAKLKELEKMKV